MLILQTERLQLTEWQPDDIPQATGMYTDPDTMRYIGAGLPYSAAHTQQGILRTIEHYKKHGYGVWKMIHRSNGEIVGHCGLRYWEELGQTEVGYLLKPDYRGQGLATEAAQATLDYAFSRLKLTEVISIAQTQNTASIKVMQRCGLLLDRQTVFHDKPVVIYKIERTDYRPTGATFIF